MTAVLSAAASYLRLGLKLVSIPAGSKAPTGNSWQNNPIADFSRLNALPKDANLGLLHAASGTCVLDIDHPEYARLALASVGISLDEIRNASGPKIRTPKSLKPIYRVPEGLELARHALAWKDEHGKSVSVFELRAGSTQDLLPPSIHPSGVAYSWEGNPPKSRDDIPELPGGLRTLWEHWYELKPMLEGASPWYVPPKPKRHTLKNGQESGDSVIASYNQHTDLRDLLTKHGYRQKGKRFIAPDSSTGIPGVNIFTSDDGLERCFSHHASDPLGDGHSHDAFSIFCKLQHGGDISAAVKDAARELGMDFGTTSANTHHANVASDHAEAEPKLPLLNWGETDDLPPLAPCVPNLPPEMIPSTLRPWIVDATERLNVHLEFIAVPALVSLGALLGRQLGIHPKQHDDWLEICNIWGALVGAPSTKKSPSIAEGTAPLDRLAAKAAQKYRDAQAGREADAEIIKLEIEGLKREARAKPGDIRAALKGKLEELDASNPPERRYFTNDGTVEKLGMLLAENPRGLLVKRDEVVGLLRTCDKAGHESDRAFYLEGWNGKGRFTIDRIGRGTLHVEALTLSVLGGIQPGPLQSFIQDAIAGDVGADGLLQRFQLIVWPDKPRPFVNVDRRPDIAARDKAYRSFEFFDSKVKEILPENGRDEGQISALRFSPEAQILFNDWHAELMTRVQSAEMEKTPAFQAHLGKYPGLMASLALLFHLLDIAESGVRPAPPVSEDSC